MIKLVATDLDGTLLNSGGKLHPDTFDVFSTLIASGVRVVIASGRPYLNVSRLFAPVFDSISVICENGGLTYVNGKLLEKKPISEQLLKQALRKIRVINHNYPVFCGIKAAYVEDTEPEFLDEVNRYYPNVELVDNLEDVAGTDDICKITVWDAYGAADTGYPALKAVSRGLRAVLSGETWTDMSVASATKGEGLKFLQDYFGIAKSECMAFGDYFNDVDLFENAEESYAMANAPLEVKKSAKHIAPSNDEFGVLSILKHLSKI